MQTEVRRHLCAQCDLAWGGNYKTLVKIRLSRLGVKLLSLLDFQCWLNISSCDQGMCSQNNSQLFPPMNKGVSRNSGVRVSIRE